MAIRVDVCFPKFFYDHISQTSDYEELTFKNIYKYNFLGNNKYI